MWWLFEDAVEQDGQEKQQVVETRQTGGQAARVAVIAVAAVNSDARSSVALAVGLAAERLVGAWLHHPAWQKRDRKQTRFTSQFSAAGCLDVKADFIHFFFDKITMEDRIIWLNFSFPPTMSVFSMQDCDKLCKPCSHAQFVNQETVASSSWYWLSRRSKAFHFLKSLRPPTNCDVSLDVLSPFKHTHKCAHTHACTLAYRWRNTFAPARKRAEIELVKRRKGYSTVSVGLTVMAHHHGTGVREAGTRFGALSVAVFIIWAHTGVTSQSVAWKQQKKVMGSVI